MLIFKQISVAQHNLFPFTGKSAEKSKKPNALLGVQTYPQDAWQE